MNQAIGRAGGHLLVWNGVPGSRSEQPLTGIHRSHDAQDFVFRVVFFVHDRIRLYHSFRVHGKRGRDDGMIARAGLTYLRGRVVHAVRVSASDRQRRARNRGTLKLAYQTKTRTELSALFSAPTTLLSPQMAFRQKWIGCGMVPQNPNADRTILFAEDDARTRKFVSALLTRCGYNVIVAENGTSALEKALEHTGVIDLLLSDIEMPGMTGIELAIQLNRERPTTKILLISGLASGMLVLNNGWQFLPKPFLSDMLRDRIRDFLAGQPPIEGHLPNA